MLIQWLGVKTWFEPLSKVEYYWHSSIIIISRCYTLCMSHDYSSHFEQPRALSGQIWSQSPCKLYSHTYNSSNRSTVIFFKLPIQYWNLVTVMWCDLVTWSNLQHWKLCAFLQLADNTSLDYTDSEMERITNYIAKVYWNMPQYTELMASIRNVQRQSQEFYQFFTSIYFSV